MMVDTYFASPERVSGRDLAEDINVISTSPVMSGVLQAVGGLIAVLNEHRQIVSLNDSFLSMLGIEDAGRVLGLRPGEAVQCIHAHEEPSGCGTSAFCSSCGAAVAIVTSLENELPAERKCALTTRRGDQNVDLVLHVKAHPIRIGGRPFVLVFLQDITVHEYRASLERTFFHDVSNMLSMLVQASEFLMDDMPSELAETIHHAALRLFREVAIQKSLFETGGTVYQPSWQEIGLRRVIQELRGFFASHRAAKGRTIHYSDDVPDRAIRTDVPALLRVLFNMITNALEASDEGGTVRIWIETEAHHVVFCVWNDRVIPARIRNRIFQRNFSTKDQPGRGIGTFSMKLFGEDVLGGTVTLSSLREHGTTFRFAHPA